MTNVTNCSTHTGSSNVVLVEYMDLLFYQLSHKGIAKMSF